VRDWLQFASIRTGVQMISLSSLSFEEQVRDAEQ